MLKKIFAPKQYDSLHKAYADNNDRSISHMIENGADVNETNINGSTILHLACHQGNIKLVKFLLTCSNINLNITNNNYDTPLNEACYSGKLKLIEILLKAGTSIDNINNVLHYAIKTKNIEMVQLFIEHECPDKVDHNGDSVVHLACANNNVKIAKLVIKDEKYSINRENLNKIRPIHIAIQNQNILLIKLLLAYGAEIDILDNQEYSLLHHACETNNKVLVEFFADKLFNHLNHLDKNDNSALHIACKTGNLEIIKILVEKNININQANNIGITPLAIAIGFDYFDIVIYLIANGANISKLVNTYANDSYRFIHGLKENIDEIYKISGQNIKLDIIYNAIGVLSKYKNQYNHDRDYISDLLLVANFNIEQNGQEIMTNLFNIFIQNPLHLHLFRNFDLEESPYIQNFIDQNSDQLIQYLDQHLLNCDPNINKTHIKKLYGIVAGTEWQTHLIITEYQAEQNYNVNI